MAKNSVDLVFGTEKPSASTLSSASTILDEEALHKALSMHDVPKLQQLTQHYRQFAGQSLATYVSDFLNKESLPFLFAALGVGWGEGVSWCFREAEEHLESLWSLRHPRGADAMMWLVGRLCCHESSFNRLLYTETLKWIREEYAVYQFWPENDTYIYSAATNALNGESVELFDALLGRYTQEQFEREAPQWETLCMSRPETSLVDQFSTCIHRHRARFEQQLLEQELPTALAPPTSPRQRL